MESSVRKMPGALVGTKKNPLDHIETQDATFVWPPVSHPPAASSTSTPAPRFPRSVLNGDASTLRFSYSASANLKWMQNFWLCKNETDFSTCTGYIASLARFMADALKMNISLELATADGLGSMVANGTWTPGVTRDVIDGKADFSIGLWDPGRCKSTECLDYMFETGFSVLVPLPKPKQLFTSFVEPFSVATWVTLTASFLAIGLFMSSLTRFYPDFTWLGLVGSVLGQDYTSNNAELASSRKGRKRKFMPMATWLVAMTFLYMCYSAVVVKYFLNQLEDQVGKWSDLVQTDYNITVNPTLVSFFQALNNSKNPTLTQMAAKAKKLDSQPPDYYPMDDEAYIDDETLLFLRLDNLKAAGDKRWRRSYTFKQKGVFPARYRTAFFAPDFPKLEAASKASRKFVEYGFNEYNRRAYLADSIAKVKDNYKGTNEKQVLKPIPLKNVYGWFVILLIGEAIAFLVFLGEIFLAMRNQHSPVDQLIDHLEEL